MKHTHSHTQHNLSDTHTHTHSLSHTHTHTWECVGVGVLVAPVGVAAHGEDAGVVFGGGSADEGPVARDQLVLADAPALLRGHSAGFSDGHVTQAVRGTCVVRTPVTVALQGCKHTQITSAN